MYLRLDNYEAKELADWLSGIDAHMSVGDRLLLAHRIRLELQRIEEIHDS